MPIIIFIFALTCSFHILAKDFPLLDFSLKNIEETTLLSKEKKPVLYGLADKKVPFSKDKIPLILVHGIKGSPSDLQEVVERFRSSPYQLYVLAYEDYHRRTSVNGEDFGHLLEDFLKIHREIVIVAHSMGGIVTRKALVDLTMRNQFREVKEVKFFSIDTPWSGFDGPSDYDFRIFISQNFFPAGLFDMRARSYMFKELNTIHLSSKVVTDISFAQEGDEALDFTEISQFVIEEQFENLESALKLSPTFPAGGTLRGTDLSPYFHRFPGNHMGVLQEQPGQFSYLDYLQEKLLHI